VYDAIAVYSVDNKLEDLYGYQLKEGKASPSRASLPPEGFKKSFVVKGDPPAQPEDRKDWSIPCGDVINKFLGHPNTGSSLTDTCHG